MSGSDGCSPSAQGPQKPALILLRAPLSRVFGQFQSAQFVTYTSPYPLGIDSEISLRVGQIFANPELLNGLSSGAGASKLVCIASPVRSNGSLDSFRCGESCVNPLKINSILELTHRSASAHGDRSFPSLIAVYTVIFLDNVELLLQ